MTSPSRILSDAVIYPFLVAGALITLAPFALGLLTSFTSARQFNTESPLSFPTPLTLANYAGLADAGFGRAFVDGGDPCRPDHVLGVGGVCVCATAIPGRDALFWVYVATLMVPGTVTVVPLYLMMAEAGLRNTFWALVLPFMFGSPYAIFLLREYFRTIPADLINTARVDGANTLDVIVHVMAPASRPILVTLALITVVSQWNNFMWPLVITSGAVRQVLAWMGGTRGNEYRGAHGAAIPAVLAAQPVYNRYWRSRGVDVGPFFTVLNGPRIAAPGGAGFAAGFDALKPYFDEMFLGRRDVASTLAHAQRAANSAAQR